MIIKLLKIWHGFSFFRKTNVKGSYSMGYHHPDSITWRWSVWFNPKFEFCWPKILPSYNMGKDWFAPNGNFGAWMSIPFVGTFSLSTQEHMWRREK